MGTVTFLATASPQWLLLELNMMNVLRLSLPKIKTVRIDGAALQERASLGCARCVE
jgi:hypothetical protein